MENTTTLMKYLGVEEITTPKQQNNGTREFAIPFYVKGKRVTLASYQTGYVRIDRNCYTWLAKSFISNMIPQRVIRLYAMCINGLACIEEHSRTDFLGKCPFFSTKVLSLLCNKPTLNPIIFIRSSMIYDLRFIGNCKEDENLKWDLLVYTE